MSSYIEEIDSLLKKKYTKPRKSPVATDAATDVKLAGLKKVIPNTISYSRRHRGNWFKPEYDIRGLQIAQHTDGILLRTIKKKSDRILISGYEFVGKSEDPVQYVKNRIKQMEFVSNKPWILLIRETAEDLFRQNNCMWSKVRSTESSSGNMRTDLAGTRLEPVAAYYQLPFEKLEFKTKVSGEIKKVRQVGDDGEVREYSPPDIIHFYTDKKAGFVIGTPELLPALDDISLLRRMEENVEELVETNLFPVYHYKIGTAEMPEVRGTDGRTESQIVKDKIEYMPAGSVYVSDWRHEIVALGSEGKALTIDNYLAYFMKRAIASAGATEVDLGMDGGSNRSTANMLSKSMTMDIEALQRILEIFINFYVINELLLEGGYDPFDPEDEVKIQFGVIDVEQRIAYENQQIQLATNNIRSINEVRTALGDKPIDAEDEEWLANTHFKMFEEPLALAKAMGSPGSAATETLAEVPSSNVTPEAVAKEKQYAEKQNKLAAKAKAAGARQAGRKPAGRAAGAKRSSASRSRPSNQSGTRASPKVSRDIYLEVGDQIASFTLNDDTDLDTIERWENLIYDRYDMVKQSGVSLQTVTNNLIYRLCK